MKKNDLEYLCAVIGNLAGIPIRIYQSGSLTFYHSLVALPADPIKPYAKKIFDIKDNLGYFTTPYFNYYGIVRSGQQTVVIGPSRQTPMSEQDMRALAFECDVKAESVGDFISAMKTLVQMPLGSILQILCTMNYVMNGEKLTLEDVSIYDFEQMSIAAAVEQERINRSYNPPAEDVSKAVHNTLSLEERLMSMISRGDTAALTDWLSHAPSVRGGIIANDALRQIKNTFIVTATLASRAAIKGGMDVEDALSLSDDYIRKCELLSTQAQIVNLQYHMVLDYTKSVERIRLGKSPSRLVIDVTNYVRRNISRPMNVEELAESLFVSRTHLAAKFKRETGMTLSEFILKEKIEEAKGLLIRSDKSLAYIGQYLGFSSQSHFTKTFKKYTNKTPKEYRSKL